MVKKQIVGDDRVLMEFEGADLATTACDQLSLLQSRGIQTHFIERQGPTALLVRNVQEIPVKLVVWRVTNGFYRMRYPTVRDGTRFHRPIVEAFYEAVEFQNPVLFRNKKTKKFELNVAQKPVKQKCYIIDFPFKVIPKPRGTFTEEDLDEIHKIAKQAFLLLEADYEKLSMTEIKFGWTQSGFLVITGVT